MGAYQLLNADSIADPYPTFEAIRAESPVRLRHRGPGEMWSVLSHEHVHDVLRDHDRFSSAGFGDFGTDLFRLVLINDDPPRHTRLRRLVNQSFSRRAVAALQPWLESTIDSALSEIGEGTTDFMQSFAKPVPLQAISAVLGIPDHDAGRIEVWLHSLLRPKSCTAEQREAYIGELVEYLGAMRSARGAWPLGDQLGSAVADNGGADGFTEAEARLEASRCLRCFLNITLDVGSCVLCGLCADVCPTNVISLVPSEELNGEPGKTALLLDESRCIRCALCVERCPSRALSMGMWSGFGIPEKVPVLIGGSA